MTKNDKLIQTKSVALSEVLACLKVDHLKELAKLHKVKNRSKMKKQELVDSIREKLVVESTVQTLLNMGVENGIEDVEAVIARVCGEHKITKTAWDLLKEYGYAAERKNDYLVAVELKDFITETIAEVELNNSDLVVDYCKALINLNGVISVNKIVEIYNSQNEDKITTEELLNYVQKNDIKYINVEEDYLVAEYITLNNELSKEKVISEHGEKPYYVPNKETLLNYADDFYYDRTPALEALERYIKKNYTKDESVLENLMNDIQGLVSVNSPLETVLEAFYNYNISFKSTKQVKKIVPYIQNVQNNTKLYTNRGYSQNELRELRGERVVNINLEPIRSNKIGRNEPCPCGSGKKYKKCCGR